MACDGILDSPTDGTNTEWVTEGQGAGASINFHFVNDTSAYITQFTLVVRDNPADRPLTFTLTFYPQVTMTFNLSNYNYHFEPGTKPPPAQCSITPNRFVHTFVLPEMVVASSVMMYVTAMCGDNPFQPFSCGVAPKINPGVVGLRDITFWGRWCARSTSPSFFLSFFARRLLRSACGGIPDDGRGRDGLPSPCAAHLLKIVDRRKNDLFCVCRW